MASEEPHPLENAVDVVRVIVGQQQSLEVMAKRIYGACQDCDPSLELLYPGFGIEPSQAAALRAAQDAAQLAVACRAISDAIAAAKPQRGVHTGPDGASRPFVFRNDTMTTRGLAATQKIAGDSGVLLDPYLTFAQASQQANLSKLAPQIRKALRARFGEKDGTGAPWDAGAWAGADRETREHIAKLGLSQLPHRDGALPDMTMHLLGELHVLDRNVPDRLDKILDPEVQSLYVKNASGTGKTRMFFEILTRQWGLYISCFWDAVQDPYGSRDVHEMLRLLEAANRNVPGGSAFFTPLEGRSIDDDPAGQDTLRRTNEQIAEHLFVIVLLARVYVLDIFLKAWNSYANGKQLSPHERRSQGLRHWCHLQIRPTLDGVGDVFLGVCDKLNRVSPQDAVREIKVFHQTWHKYKSWFQLKLVIVDEAQHATSKFPRSFPADSSSALTRPVLRPLVVALLGTIQVEAGLKLCIGGTKLGEQLVHDALVTSLGKFHLNLTAFEALGDHSDPRRIRSILTHFFGRKYAEGIPPSLMSSIGFWLSGRYRFLSLFVQFCLSEGPGYDKMENVLWNIVARLTGHRISVNMVDIPSMTLAPILSDTLLRTPITQEVKDLALDLQMIVIRLLIGRSFPTLDAAKLDLVTLGVGRIQPLSHDNRSLIFVNEPLILTAIVGWVNEHMAKMLPGMAAALKAHINDRFDDAKPALQGVAKEDLIIYLLWRKFSGQGAQLDEVFDFDPYIVPSWAHCRAQLVSASASLNATKDSLLTSPELTTPLVFEARTKEETLRWFENQDRTRFAFLKPDERLGPDIILILRLASGKELIILIQCKCWHGSARKSAEVVEDAIFKLSPEGLYYSSRHSPRDRIHTAAMKSVHEKLERLCSLGPVMPPRPERACATAPYDSNGNATVPLLRVFAAFKGSYEKVDSAAKDLGAYPFAYLCDQFMEFGAIEFPAFKLAMDQAIRMQSGRPV